MHSRKTSLATLLFGLFVFFGAASSRAVEEPARPVMLGGVWKLSKSLSDDPGRKLMEAMRGGDGPGRGGGRPTGGGMGGPERGMGGAGGGGGMAGPGGRGAGGRGGAGSFGGEPPLDGTSVPERAEGEAPRGPRGGAGSGPAADQRGGMRGIAASPEFAIEQEGESLAFRTENNLRILRADGQKRKKEGASGKLDVVAKFSNGALVVESRPEMGGKRRETYTLQPDGKLQIDFEIEGSGPMPSLKFKLVYEVSPAG